jgi:transcription termination factor Rho
MSDAKGVEGTPSRPSLLRAAAARRLVRKTATTSGDSTPVASPPPESPSSAAAVPGSGPPTASVTEVRATDGTPVETRSMGESRVPAEPRLSERPMRAPSGVPFRLDDLYRMPMPQLFKLAEKEGIHEHSGMNRAQLIVAIVRRQIERGEIVRGSGTLEILPDGYGFLRSQAHNYLASPEDIYVSPSQIRRMSLRTGLVVEGPIRLPIENQDNFAIMQIERVNGRNPDEIATLTNFEDLTPLHPNQRLRLETTPDEISMRIVDLITPIGKGNGV